MVLKMNIIKRKQLPQVLQNLFAKLNEIYYFNKISFCINAAKIRIS